MIKTMICPTCGAPTSTKTGVCEYCGSALPGYETLVQDVTEGQENIEEEEVVSEDVNDQSSPKSSTQLEYVGSISQENQAPKKSKAWIRVASIIASIAALSMIVLCVVSLSNCPLVHVTSGSMIDMGLSVKWASSNYGTEFDRKEVINLVQDSPWGENWRIPTDEEWNELLNACEWSWGRIKFNPLKADFDKGYKVTAPNGNSIFLHTYRCVTSPRPRYFYEEYCTSSGRVFFISDKMGKEVRKVSEFSHIAIRLVSKSTGFSTKEVADTVAGY